MWPLILDPRVPLRLYSSGNGYSMSQKTSPLPLFTNVRNHFGLFVSGAKYYNFWQFYTVTFIVGVLQ